MKYGKFIDDALIHQQPNIRAEDGMQQGVYWNEFFKYVIIPVGTLFAVFGAMLGMMLFNR
jgi:hypothetical protein